MHPKNKNNEKQYTKVFENYVGCYRILVLRCFFDFGCDSLVLRRTLRALISYSIYETLKAQGVRYAAEPVIPLRPRCRIPFIILRKVALIIQTSSPESNFSDY